MAELFLALDVETTGLPSSKKSLNDPSQPHLVSCSALQFTPTGYIQQSMSRLVSPEDWNWDEESPAFKVHQLSVEHCSNFGASEQEVLDNLLHLWYARGNTALLLAHNLEFERAIIAIALSRYYPGEAKLLATWQDTPGTCTMLANKDRIDARTAKGAKKYPNLKETYRHFLGEDLERHHSANADAVAVYQIFMAMQQ
jgi:DNA polymerase III epsilon subunit-like protein